MLRLGVSFLTFEGLVSLTFWGLVFLRLRVSQSYVWGLVFLRLEVSQCYV